MQNAGLRRSARLLATITTIALVLFSVGVTALMQDAGDPAARKRPSGPRPATQNTPIKLAPVPNSPQAQLILDPTFEAGDPWPAWTTQTSSFGTPLCDVPVCGTGDGSAAPFSGDNWAWFGGIAFPENATLGQAVTIPTGVTASLTFQLRIGSVSSPFTDTLTVEIDGTTLQTFTEPSLAEAGYTLRTFDVTAFATGTSHTILFTYVGPSTDFANFTVDDVNLNTNAPTAAPATISGKITTHDGQPLGGVTMNLSGARSAKVITDSNGNYRFNDVDTDNFYTVTPSLVNYHFNPINRSFSLLANMTDAVFTAIPETVIVGNAIDTAEYFVRQHYLDFLGREPDESGFNFWSDQMLECGNDAGCLERRTINVSAAYFLSIEFQETGGLVDGLYRASYNRQPLYNEFMPDTGTIAQNVVVGHIDWEQQLAMNKQSFVQAWVQRSAFRDAYDSLSNDSYVDTLISHTGVSYTESERDALVSGLAGNTLTRAGVLLRIVDDERFVSAKRKETFVMMEYFGYLRRDPDDSGFQFWLNKLNQFDGNFEQAEMVKAFITSGEYRSRFVR